MTYTHTYVTVEVSKEVWDEVAAKLHEAGYDHAFTGDVIDMHGLALVLPVGTSPSTITEEEWNKVLVHARECKKCGDELVGKEGVFMDFYMAGINNLLGRYGNGERTQLLYEGMRDYAL